MIWSFWTNQRNVVANSFVNGVGTKLVALTICCRPLRNEVIALPNMKGECLELPSFSGYLSVETHVNL